MTERDSLFKREIRRSKVYDLYCQGYSQSEIARSLGIGIGTVHRIITEFRAQAAAMLLMYFEEWFPEEFAKCLASLNLIQKETWSVLIQATDTKERIQLLGVVIECLTKKMQLLTNPAILDNAKRYLSNHPNSSNPKSTGTDDNSNSAGFDPEKGVF
jgi:Homeodomain-like domain